MVNTKTFHGIVGLFVLGITILGALNWMSQPEKAKIWVIGMLAMPCIWFFVYKMLRKRPLSEYGDAEKKFFLFSVFCAGAILVAAMVLRLLDNATSFNFSSFERIWGIALGLLLIGVGNITPKILSPLSTKGCSSAQNQDIQRFSGWVFVIAGVVSTLAFIFAPIPIAKDITLIAVFISLLLVLFRYLLRIIQMRSG